MKIYRQLIPYFNQNKKLLIGGIFAALIVATASIAPIYIFKSMIQVFDQAGELKKLSDTNTHKLTQIDETQIHSLIQQYQDQFLWLIFVGVIIVLILVAFSFLQNYLMGLFGKKLLFNLRNQLYNRILHLPMSYFHKERRGKVLSIVNNDLLLLERFSVEKMINLIKEPLIIIGSIITMIYMSQLLTLALFLLVPIHLFLIYTISNKIKNVEKALRNQFSDLTAHIHQTLSNLKIIKILGTEKKEKEKFLHQSETFLNKEEKLIFYEALNRPSIELIGALSLIFMVGIGGHQLLHQNLSLDQLMGFIAALFILFNPVREISRVFVLLKQTTVALERIFGFMETPLQHRIERQSRIFTRLEQDIVFDQVSLVYDEKPVLDDISFQIRPGEVIGIVGESGEGKSSIAGLLSLLYTATKGVIYVNGYDISEYEPSSLKSRISLIPQEDFLFYATIKENILYGKPNASLDELIEACRIANAYDFIIKLPSQFNTLVGEEGITLSGGEKQRIAMARAIIRKPELLILDEATASLDSKSEMLIQKTIQQVMKDQTTLIITHHFSTLIHANRILVLKEGKIIESGTHNQLLSQNGEYKKSFETQKDSFIIKTS